MTSLNEASVYWIHLSVHDNPLTEGYIGVSKNWGRRIREHLDGIKKGSHTNTHFVNASLKYGVDNLITDIILVGEEKFCYEVERSLRPVRNIGWNMAPGGHSGPGRNKGSPGKIRSREDQLLFDENKRSKIEEKERVRQERDDHRITVSENRRLMKERHLKIIEGRLMKIDLEIRSLMEVYHSKIKLLELEKSKLSSENSTTRHNASMEITIINNYLSRLVPRIQKLKKKKELTVDAEVDWSNVKL